MPIDLKPPPSIDADTLLVTMHPATRDDRSTAESVEALLSALNLFPDKKILITYPNNDADGRVIIRAIERYAAENPSRVKIVPSLGRTRYLSALKYVAAVVGNSSSGIVEVPSMNIPTVDIGIRQRGRIAAPSVIHCDPDTNSIARAISLALSPSGRSMAREAVNPYYQPDTLTKMVDAIVKADPAKMQIKKFYDLPRQ